MLKRLEEPQQERVARSFVSPDRQYARFILRMREGGRRKSRQEIVARIHQIVRRHGFEPALTGGIYHLEAKLSELVATSLVQGFAALLGLFALITFFVSRSPRATLATLAMLAAVAVLSLGLGAWSEMPLDIVSGPSASIVIAIGIDATIHLLFLVRRHRWPVTHWTAWVEARRQLWQPIAASSLIVALGFSVFLLSDFPPTQRFGFLVSAGTLLNLGMVLFLLPLLVAREKSN
ncbi:MAG: MMPL family transporter [Acidobacteria bacterium]|nr:MMPL family transporter [Acidobacteriota bacterium]